MSVAPLRFNSDAASFAAGLRSARGMSSARQRPRHSRNGSGLHGGGSAGGLSGSQRNLITFQSTLALALHPDLPLLAARRASPPWRWLLCLFVILCLYVVSDVLTAQSEAFPSFSSGDAFLVAAWLSHYAGAVCFLSGGLTMLLGRVVIRSSIMALFGFALAAFVVSSVLHTSRLEVSAAEMARNSSGAMRTMAVQFGWAANLCFAVLFATLAYKAPLTGWVRPSTQREQLDKVHTLMDIRDAEAARSLIVTDLARMDAQQAEIARLKEQQVAQTKALWDARDQAAAASAKDPDAHNTLTLEDLAADGDDPNPSLTRQAAQAAVLSPSALSNVSLPLSSAAAGGAQSTVIHYTLPSENGLDSEANPWSPAPFQTIVHPAAGSSAVKSTGPAAASVASTPQRVLHPSVDGDPVIQMSAHRRGGSNSGAGGSADLHFFTPHGKLQQAAQQEQSPVLAPTSLSPHTAAASPSHFAIPLTPEAAGGSRVSRAADEDEE